MNANAILLAAATLAMALPTAASAEPVTTEYYYRIKWGSFDEFMQLYKRNHQPILDEMKKQGFITAMRIETPLTHLAGDIRWDLRVTVTTRDADSAVGITGPYTKAAMATAKRLFPDKAKFDAEERKRFSLLEEHWDVIVVPGE
jgi:hypothetical protein